MKRTLAAPAIMLCLFAIPFATLAQAPAKQTLLNQPDVTAWHVYGPGQTSTFVHDKAVQGGGALDIKIAATKNVWDIGASVPVTTAFHKGDHIVVVVTARAGGPDAATELDIPTVLQGADSPYPSFFPGTLKLTSKWRLVEFDGVAMAHIDAGKAQVALSLGGDAKEIELGPVFVLDQGQ